jgi:hypothetical protein
VQWLLYVPPNSTFWNSAFCPPFGFNNTAVISLNIIKQYVFVMETVCVFCESGTEFLSIISIDKENEMGRACTTNGGEEEFI